MLRATVARSRATVLSRLLHKTPAISPFSLLLSSPFSRSKYSSAKGRGDDGDDSFSILNRDPESPPKLFVIQPRLRPESLLRSKLSEALNLANSLEERRDGFYAEDFASKKMPPHLIVQNPPSRSTRADTYFGPGTVDNIKCHLKAMESEGGLDAVFINAILSGIQQRNLEMVWGKPVLDRVGLIIEIFNAHAETKEAKLQAELAALMYKRSRLVRVRGQGGRLTFGTGGEAEVVSARGRGSGGRGFISGAGETELQLQRRRIHERRKRLLSEIEEVRRTRAVQRAARKRHGGTDGKGLATVAVVGYTNAGKSTLVSSLSESDVYSDDRLFATVDPRLRSVILPSGRKVLLCDTVGFISDLPVQLVEAFHATLEEVVEADLLLHVLDASSPDLDEQRATVLEVLRKIGVAEEKIQNMIEVWNKVDLLDKKAGADETIEHDLFSEGEIDETIPDKENLSAVEEEENIFVSEEMECVGESEDEEDETISGEKCLSGYEADHGFMSDEDKYKTASDMSAGEGCEGFQDRQAASLEQQVTDLQMPHDAKAYAKVEISAVMGTGLQELLNVIDKKLCAQDSVVTKSFGYFDRKWRPSYTADAEKSAQQ